ncbi:alpha/beta hydrolase [Massilia sp. YIM B02763]|uniref:alpha/beta hydrolase n=1 Tax=Massilia sp. YIM B02763 TaxID=3050130 RepID=UPI0025B64D22|nr:alpha/beta hydrolase [Massilia sp. YIM B02763]MDN4053818.1 alpha/beta hydrolase [Massilia sp. YIM B02763]
MSDDQQGGVKLPQRLLPIPASISPQAQAALRRMVNADGVPVNALHAMPAPDDLDGWQRVKAGADAWYAESLGEGLAAVRAGVQTIAAGSATIYVAHPAQPISADCALVDLHGGALVFGGGDACRASTRLQADQYGLACYGVDYRMPPEHPYPAALDDCLAAYRHVLAHHAPERIAVAGRSAGGNLAAALLLRARDEGLPLPAAVVLLSPEADLTESGDSFALNQLADVVLPGSLMANNLLYAGGADLAHPYLSPLFGDFAPGFPPTLLQSGTRDLFLSNTVRMHRALRGAGIEAELHVFEAMPHGGFMGAPEDEELVREVARFLRTRLGIQSKPS